MPGTWQLKINSTFDNQSEQHSLGVFNYPLVAIKVTSADAFPTWRKGGMVSQSLIVDGNKTAFTAQQDLTLNKLSVYEFPLTEEAEYELVYFPLPRLPQVNIEVWEYTGEVENQLVDQIVAALETQATLQTQLTPESLNKILALSEKIDDLIAHYNEGGDITLPDNLVYKTDGKILLVDLPDEIVYTSEFNSLLPANLVYTSSGKISNSLLNLQEYTSLLISPVISSIVTLTLPFNLTRGAVIRYFFLNKVASVGYAPGDLVEAIPGGNSAAITSYFAENSNQLKVVFGTVLPVVRRLDNYLTASISATNWDLIVGVRQWG